MACYLAVAIEVLFVAFLWFPSTEQNMEMLSYGEYCLEIETVEKPISHSPSQAGQPSSSPPLTSQSQSISPTVKTTKKGSSQAGQPTTSPPLTSQSQSISPTVETNKTGMVIPRRSRPTCHCTHVDADFIDRKLIEKAEVWYPDVSCQNLEFIVTLKGSGELKCLNPNPKSIMMILNLTSESSESVVGPPHSGSSQAGQPTTSPPLTSQSQSISPAVETNKTGAEEDRLVMVGGTEAKPHSRPYMVSLQNRRGHLCGGILVREDFVLTAAHCNVFSQYRVVLGAHSLHSSESTQQVLGISKFYSHPKYNQEKHNNDVMLLKLNRNASLTSSVQVIPLLNQLPLPSKLCSTAGWGDVGDNGTLPDKLHEVNAIILGKPECTRRYKDRVTITETMVCATGQMQFQGFCSGYAGGPLVCDGMASGIVSFSGVRCGDNQSPDVYMLIPLYRKWIKSVLKLG